jgi:hypothetical protein
MFPATFDPSTFPNTRVVKTVLGGSKVAAAAAVTEVAAEAVVEAPAVTAEAPAADATASE